MLLALLLGFAEVAAAVGGSGCLLVNERSSVYTSVFENAPLGSVLTEIPVLGETRGPDASVQLRLVKGQEFAALDASSKQLKLITDLDRDKGLARFEVVVECRSLIDNQSPQLNISTFVTVKDVNDNAPVFDRESYEIRLPEELPPGTPVALEFEATDDDQDGPNSYVRYKIVETDGPALLRIPDPYKPQIVVADRINYESLKKFVVDIEAEDAGSPPKQTRARLTVNVDDVDDLNPVFDHENYHTNSIQDSIFEVFPDPIRAKDGDTLNDPIFYELSGEFSEFYSINSSGVVRLVDDTVISTTLFVHARQVNRPERFATAILRVTNQSSIEFQHLLYSVQLTSNSPKGMEVAQVKAISSTPGTKLRYSILEDESHVAYIEDLTGRVFLNATPTRSKYSMRLLATDGKSRAWSRLELTVRQVNVYEPEFDQPEYEFDMRNADIIGQVRALDRDENDTVAYRLVNFQELFKVDGEGLLSVMPDVSLTAGSVYELVVVAEDSQRHRNFVNVYVHTRANSGYFSLPLYWGLLSGVLVLAGATLVISGMFCVRRLRSLNSWPRDQQESWRSKTLPDTGVVITRTASMDADGFGRFSMPGEDNNKDNESVSYSNASTSYPRAAAVTHATSPERLRAQIAASTGTPISAPTIYF